MFTELFNLLSNFDDNSNIFEEYDLSNPEDVKKAHALVESLRNDKLAKAMLSMFVPNEDLDKFFDNADNLIDKTYNKNHQQVTPEKKQVIRTVIDNTIKEESQKVEKKTAVERPSVKIDINAGLQIHKLVQEYVDTMVKPYNNGVLNQAQINDAYAGLYEFACWIFNHE